MNNQDLELIEKCAALILSGYIANPDYSSKYQNEYISEAIDYAVELHKQIETKLNTHELIKLDTYNLKYTTISRPKEGATKISYLRCIHCGEVHYDSEVCPHNTNLEITHNPIPTPVPQYWSKYSKCLVCGEHHDNGNLPCPYGKFTSGK